MLYLFYNINNLKLFYYTLLNKWFEKKFFRKYKYTFVNKITFKFYIYKKDNILKYLIKV